MAIYLDLLFLINFIFNILLLTIAGWMGGQRFRVGRYCLAALVGDAFWLIFFFFPQYICIDWICRISGGLAMAFIAWRPAGIKVLLTKTILLVIAGQLVGGGIYSLAYALSGTPLGKPQAFSMAVIAGGGAIMLGIAGWWAGRIHRTEQLSAYLGQVKVRMGGKTLTVPALLDSGNTLRHPVSNWPVVVLERQAARQLFSSELRSWLDEPSSSPPQGLETRIGLIPYSTLGGSGLLPAVRPDSLTISCKSGQRTFSRVYVAVRQKQQLPLEYQALAFPAGKWKEEGGLA